MLIFSIHAVNVILGGASFSRTFILPSSDAMTWFKVHGQMVIMVVQGIMMATAISLVEELHFRSWLPQEIALDFGYHLEVCFLHGVIFCLFPLYCLS